MGTVAELVAELLTVEAQAAAVEERRKELRRQLEERARAAHEAEGALPKWAVPGAGSVSWCERKGGPVVVDPAGFLGWVEEHYPAEANAVERRPAGWVTNELVKTGATGPEGELITRDGELVAGVKVSAPTHYLSVRLDPTAKARAAAAADERVTARSWAGEEVDLGGMAPAPDDGLDHELAEERW